MFYDADILIMVHGAQMVQRSKITFLNQDASMFPQFARNDIDIGFCSLVLHEMPRRVPMDVLCELAVICKYVVVVDWVGPVIRGLRRESETRIQGGSGALQRIPPLCAIRWDRCAC